jgi:phosphoenolpyruvate synthase/pyruvate phosphate dikinase
MISAAWGLGVSVVDGSTPTDEYRVAKKTRTIISRIIAEKEELLASSDGTGLDSKPVPEDMQEAACLSDAQVLQRADYAIRLEKHYGFPLDIEWALDDEDRLFILQARALNPQTEGGEESEEQIPVPAHAILVQGGATASRIRWPMVASAAHNTRLSRMSISTSILAWAIISPPSTPSAGRPSTPTTSPSFSKEAPRTSPDAPEGPH